MLASRVSMNTDKEWRRTFFAMPGCAKLATGIDPVTEAGAVMITTGAGATGAAAHGQQA